MSRVLTLTICLLIFGCSGRPVDPEKIKNYQGNYLDTFKYQDLSSNVLSALKTARNEGNGLSGRIEYSLTHYKNDVVEWHGKSIKSYRPAENGVTRIKTEELVNEFPNLTIYEMSYLGLSQFDAQALKPGWRNLYSDYRVADLDFIQADPLEGLNFKMELGRRTQIADFWKREVNCEAKGSQYEASSIHNTFTGYALDFKCLTTDGSGDLIEVRNTSYLIDYSLFIPREIRNISGKYIYSPTLVELK